MLGVMLAFSAAASAQEENPKDEIFAGYSYVRMNASGVPGFNMNGGSASISVNPRSYLGIVFDFGGYHVGSIGGVPFEFNIYSYLLGPKLAYRTERFTPFVQALFGGVHATPNPLGRSVEGDAFAMTVGGGLDVNATSHLAVRFIQADYFLTRFAETESNVRISAGVVLRF